MAPPIGGGGLNRGAPLDYPVCNPGFEPGQEVFFITILGLVIGIEYVKWIFGMRLLKPILRLKTQPLNQLKGYGWPSVQSYLDWYWFCTCWIFI